MNSEQLGFFSAPAPKPKAALPPLREPGPGAPIRIELTSEELEQAVYAGTARSQNAVRRGRKLEPGRKDAALRENIRGATGERAAVKHYGLPWKPELDRPDTRFGDIAPGIQVKAVHSLWQDLTMQYEEAKGPRRDAYILTQVSDGGVVELIGWAYGHEIERAGLVREQKNGIGEASNKFYFLPRHRLRPLHTLKVPA